MSPRRLLVVTTASVDADVLREEVHRHAGDGETELRVVATASDLSPLEWLATDEDEARREAADRADAAREAVAGEGRAEADIGDADPVQAIEDALRTFPADEIIVVTHRDEEAGWLEEGSAETALERFRLPVTHLEVGG